MKLSDLLLEFILMIPVVSIIPEHFLISPDKMSMQIFSFQFRVRMLSLMSVYIISMIINNWSFRIKSNYSWLQSFNFNLLRGYGHLRIVQLFLNNNFLFIYLLVNCSSFSFFRWAAFVAGGWSFAAHFSEVRIVGFKIKY